VSNCIEEDTTPSGTKVVCKERGVQIRGKLRGEDGGLASFVALPRALALVVFCGCARPADGCDLSLGNVARNGSPGAACTNALARTAWGPWLR
jgi:hypothetical protein